MSRTHMVARITASSVAAVSIGLLWIAPPLGLVAVAVCLVLLPPWGRSLAERAVISGLVLLGVIALVFPRAGSFPVDHLTSRLVLAGVLVGALAAQFAPGLQARALIPRPRWTDAVVLIVAVVAAWGPITLYRGLPIDKVISGLYVSGWDNQGHFNTFANTLAAQSTTWTTADGSIAWNQWYPSLHTTTYAVMQEAISNADLNRLAMVEPFAIWSALAFAACLAALTFVASDAARRWAKRQERSAQGASLIAAMGMGAALLLGSVNYLFNSGFTNFLMAATVTIVASYVAASSARRARTLGWFLLPLAAVVVIGLWTPLVLGLIPAGVVTALSILRWRRWVALVWIVAVAVGGAFIAVTQLQAILAGSEGVSVAEFNEQIGEVGVGMAPFNVGLAIAAPLLAILIGFLSRRQVGAAYAWTLAFPAVAAGVLAVYFVGGTDAAGISRLSSYYVLKSLDAAVIMVAPLVIAFLAVGVASMVDTMSRVQQVAALGAVGLIAVTAFGYVGVTPERLQPGFVAAPGIAAAQVRLEGAGEQLVGSGIEAAAREAQKNPEYVPLLWDGSGHLVNLWVGSLTNTVSMKQARFYGNMPEFPYEEPDLGYLDLALNSNAGLDINVLWFRPVSGELLDGWSRMLPEQRVITNRLVMPSTPLCPECTGM